MLFDQNISGHQRAEGLQMPSEVTDRREVSLPQVKKILRKRKKQGELSFQQTITMEHAKLFSKMAPAVARDFIKRMEGKYELDRSTAVQIANIAPTSLEELRSILGKHYTGLTEEEMIEIVDRVKMKRK